MKELYQKILSSFDTHSQGFSSRKLTSFVITACVVAVHIKWIALGDFSKLESVLYIDYMFIGALLGLVTYQSIKEKKTNIDEQK